MISYIVFAVVIYILIFKLSRANRNIDTLAHSLREAESKLNKQIEIGAGEKAKLETVLSSMVEGVLLVDSKREILLINSSLRKTFLIELPPEGKRPLEVIRNTALHDIVCHTLDEKRLISEEIMIMNPEERSFLVNSVPIIRNEKINGAVLVFHDITELKRLEKIRRDFVANVSHELRTPLSSIKGYAETLLQGAIEDKEHAKDFVNIIHENSDNLTRLIDDLLDLSKIESGTMKMTFVPVDIANISGKAVKIIENQAKKKSISITLNIPEGLPKVMADETSLSQVFVNFLDNAVKYTPAGGSVGITARKREDKKEKGFEDAVGFVEIDISDTGIGIPKEDISRIFERFYRVDKARSRELGGTGLGLSIVKNIIQAHGGEVFVRSTPGQGSIFSFCLPVI